jgi:hypothetical protein
MIIIIALGRSPSHYIRPLKVTFEEGQRLAEELGGLPFLETSAKLGINVDKAFYELVCSQRALARLHF